MLANAPLPALKKSTVDGREHRRGGKSPCRAAVAALRVEEGFSIAGTGETRAGGISGHDCLNSIHWRAAAQAASHCE